VATSGDKTDRKRERKIWQHARRFAATATNKRNTHADIAGEKREKEREREREREREIDPVSREGLASRGE